MIITSWLRSSLDLDNTTTEKAIYELLNALNNRSMIGGIFCDLKKHLTA
jgi:hypothetical protein